MQIRQLYKKRVFLLISKLYIRIVGTQEYTQITKKCLLAKYKF